MNRKDCSRNFSEDAVLRAAYRAAAAHEQEIDIWPQVSASLHVKPVQRQLFLRPRAVLCAWGAALATIIIAGVCCWHPAFVMIRDMPPIVSTHNQPAAASQSILAVDAMADVPRVNPAVDDPARSSVEQIWVQLGNRPVTEAQTQ